MILYLLTTLLQPVISEIASTEIAILRYEALKYHEIENLEHLYYSFEFCSCNSGFSGQLPDRSSQCECTGKKKGKSVIRSTPHVNYPSSCIHSFSAHRCMNAKFIREKSGKKIFVKVMIGNKIFTYPSWQPLKVTMHTTTTTLKSTVGSDMKLKYIISLKKNTNHSTSRKSSKQVRKPTSHRRHHLKSLFSKKPSMFSFIRRKFFHRNQHHSSHTENSRFDGLSNEEKSKAIAAYETKTTRRSHSPVTSRPPTMHNQRSINDVLHLKRINDIRVYLMKQSLADRHDPAHYDIKAMKRELLYFHNVYRERHGAPAVVEDSRLNVAAQRWADHLGSKQGCLVHEQPHTYGENLFYFSSQHLPSALTMAKGVIQGFYMEGFGYNYSSFKSQSYYKTGHFTQLIWQASRKIGVGVSIRRHDGRKRGPCQPSRPSYMVYVCVKYDPPGNMQSHNAYMKNVRPIKG